MPSCRPAFQGIYIYTACEEVMQIQVAVKVGEIGPTSRTKSALKTVASPLMKRARRSTNSGISCISARGIRTQTVRLDKTIYLILGLKTPQRDWIAISESNWQTNLDAVQANHQRRTKSGPIVVELVAFVANEQSGIRCATEAEWKRLHERLIVLFESILIFMWAR
ncbi:hypothetical protein GQ600_1126 [Phytophthora cactorum]|nr:hypothetical protein GQ600_1126 [Phytophthora cactorum]